MIDGKLHIEYKWRGRWVILDSCQLYPDRFETLLLYRAGFGDEIASRTSPTAEGAAADFAELARLYPEDGPAAPLSGKYAKLRDDLKKALLAGVTAEQENPEDGGTCNFDAPSLFLPKWREEKVKQAAEEAGTHCSAWTLWGIKRFVFQPKSNAQANARTRNAEAVTKSLKELGYDAFCYSAMD
jgi:hypothetical protein